MYGAKNESSFSIMGLCFVVWLECWDWGIQRIDWLLQQLTGSLVFFQSPRSHLLDQGPNNPSLYFLRCLKYIFGCNELIIDCWIVTCYGDKEIRVCSRHNAVVLGGKPWLLLTAQVDLNFITILFSPGNQILHVECQELNLGTYPVTTRRVCEWVLTSVATSSEFNTDVQWYEDYIYCFSDAE